MFVSIGKIVNIFAHEKGRSLERPNRREVLVLLHFSRIFVGQKSYFLSGFSRGECNSVTKVEMSTYYPKSSHVGGCLRLYSFSRISSDNLASYPLVS